MTCRWRTMFKCNNCGHLREAWHNERFFLPGGKDGCCPKCGESNRHTKLVAVRRVKKYVRRGLFGRKIYEKIWEEKGESHE
jgi:hypothetical protein